MSESHSAQAPRLEENADGIGTPSFHEDAFMYHLTNAQRGYEIGSTQSADRQMTLAAQHAAIYSALVLRANEVSGAHD